MKRNDNPIALRLKSMLESGQLLKKKCTSCRENDILGIISEEGICWATGIKYASFKNIFNRARVSKASLALLQAGGIIDYEVINQYHSWLREQNLPLEGRGGKRKTHRKNKPKQPPRDPEEDFIPTREDRDVLG